MSKEGSDRFTLVLVTQLFIAGLIWSKDGSEDDSNPLASLIILPNSFLLKGESPYIYLLIF